MLRVVRQLIRPFYLKVLKFLVFVGIEPWTARVVAPKTQEHNKISAVPPSLQICSPHPLMRFLPTNFLLYPP